MLDQSQIHVFQTPNQMYPSAKATNLNIYRMAESSNLPKNPSWILQFLIDADKVTKKPPISKACVQSRGLYENKINPKLAKKLNKDT